MPLPFQSHGPSALSRCTRDERGYTLTELLVVMAILGIVMGALAGLFTSASSSEAEMNRRFQAQQQALVALDTMRRELHCAQTVSPTSGTLQSITVTLGTSCGGGSVTWCTIASGTVWQLWRTPGSTCTSTGGVKWADQLIVPHAFTPTDPAASLPYVHVDLQVNVKGPSSTQGTYRLTDDIVLRNAVRA
jgi:prepilin-type N-terminal cleavage/methylation domain-containing protein